MENHRRQATPENCDFCLVDTPDVMVRMGMSKRSFSRWACRCCAQQILSETDPVDGLYWRCVICSAPGRPTPHLNVCETCWGGIDHRPEHAVLKAENGHRYPNPPSDLKPDQEATAESKLGVLFDD